MGRVDARKEGACQALTPCYPSRFCGPLSGRRCASSVHMQTHARAHVVLVLVPVLVLVLVRVRAQEELRRLVEERVEDIDGINVAIAQAESGGYDNEAAAGLHCA